MAERWRLRVEANSPHATQTVMVVDPIALGAAQSGQRFDPHLEQHHPASARGWRLHRGALEGTRNVASDRPADWVRSAERNSPSVYQSGVLRRGSTQSSNRTFVPVSVDRAATGPPALTFRAPQGEIDQMRHRIASAGLRFGLLHSPVLT